MIEPLVQDFRYAARSLGRTPGFTGAAILMLAISIGASTTVFSVVDALVVRPLPAPEAERLFRVFTVRPDGSVDPHVSFPNVSDLKQTNGLTSLAGYALTPFTLGAVDGSTRSERVWGALVSGNYFDTLGVRPAIGRAFLPEEDASPGEGSVLVISDRLWRTRLAADPLVVGRTLRLNGQPFTIVGVAAPDMPRPDILFATDVWLPLSMQAQAMPGQPWKRTSRTDTWLSVIGRLPSEDSLDSVQAALDVSSARMQRDHASEITSLSLLARPERAARSQQLPGVAPFGFGALTLMAIVLVIACANIAGLLLARATARRGEFALRASLGASRSRLVRQIMAESSVLSVLGGLAGFGVAAFSIGGLLRLVPPLPVELALDARIDVRVMLFALVVSVVTACLAGLLPSFQSTGRALTSAIHGGDRHSTYRLKGREALVVAQVTVSLVLLVLTGLFVRSWQHATRVDLGFAQQNRLLGTVDLGRAAYGDSDGARLQLRLLDEIAQLPGVVAASFTAAVPLGPGYLGNGRIYLEADRARRPEDQPLAYYDVVGPGYFQAMGSALRSGRDFTRADRSDTEPVAIVNETFARRLWPGMDPLGRRFRFGSPDRPSVEVVGVVADGKYQTVGETPQLHVFFSALQRYSSQSTFVVHTSDSPEVHGPAVRAAVQALDPDLPVTDMRSMTEHLGFALYPARASAILLVFCGSFGLLLAIAGVYGVVAYMVRRRTREIALRSALGAAPRDIIRALMMPAVRIVGYGLGLGLVASIAISQLIRGALYGTSSLDALTFVSAPVLLLVVALLATARPVQRAALVNPVQSLTAE
jgi:putative ABC transport system permease protein